MDRLQIVIKLLIGLCFVLTFLACYIEPIQSNVKAVTTSILLKKMEVSQSKYFNYERLSMYIKANGVSYLLSDSINPVSYIITKLVASALVGGLMLAETKNVLAFVLFFVATFYIFDYLVEKNNESDNKKMLTDITNIYDVLKIQLKAGVFITDSIYFCYKNCRNKRIKDGLFLLYVDMKTSSNISEALRRFDLRFKNTNISTLCAVLEQSLVTGQVEKVLENISKKNVILQRLDNKQRKKALEDKFHLLSFLSVVGIFAGLFMVMWREFYNMILQF